MWSWLPWIGLLNWMSSLLEWYVLCISFSLQVREAFFFSFKSSKHFFSDSADCSFGSIFKKNGTERWCEVGHLPGIHWFVIFLHHIILCYSSIITSLIICHYLGKMVRLLPVVSWKCFYEHRLGKNMLSPWWFIYVFTIVFLISSCHTWVCICCY